MNGGKKYINNDYNILIEIIKIINVRAINKNYKNKNL
jgi:hypothetical protein